MAFVYDLSTDTGKCRALIPDTNWETHVFEDEEIAAHLALEGGNVKRAVALALETLASNEALLYKAIRVLDIQTDGTRTAETLLKRAGALRAQADAEDEKAEMAGGGAFDVAEMALDAFTARQLALNAVRRGVL